MDSEQVSTELLRGFSPLDGLKRDNLAALARKVQIRELSPGQLLFKDVVSRRINDRVDSGDFDDVGSDLYEFTDAEKSGSGFRSHAQSE